LSAFDEESAGKRDIEARLRMREIASMGVAIA
jgi:hypothetical protein